MDLLRFLLRLPFILIRFCFKIISVSFHILGKLLRPMLGHWQAPAWSRVIKKYIGLGFNATESWIGRHVKSVSAFILACLLGGASAFYGYHWYLNQPKPIPAATIVEIQTYLKINTPKAVNYNQDTPTPQPLTLQFPHSVAPIEHIGKPIDSGIELTPAIAGKWSWVNEKTLRFIPDNAFPMGQEYSLKLDDKVLLAPHISLEKNTYKFTTESFGYRFGSSEFYQDPQNPSHKSVIFQVVFNAPVDVKSFEKNIHLFLPSSNEKTPATINYSVNYNNKKTEAWIRSASLDLPDKSQRLMLTINPGVTATVASNRTSKTESTNVSVPGLYSLNIRNISATLVDTESNNSKKVLLIESSDAVKDKALSQSLTAWLLPQHDIRNNNISTNPDYFYPWSLNSIDEQVLQSSENIPLTLGDAENEYQTLHNFTFDVPSRRSILVKITRNLDSVGGYKLAEDRYQVLTVPDYPQVLRFMSKGSLLSMSGEKRLTVVARNLPGMKLDIKRVIPDQLQHLVSFNQRDYGHANFGRLSAEHFTEHFEHKQALPESQPGELIYQGVDLSRFLSNSSQSKRGVFLVTLSSWNPRDKQPARDGEHDEEYEDEYYEDESKVFENRLIVVTDLGILTKRSLHGERDVFVQSIHSGQPVAGAKVSVIGKNGVTLLSDLTGNGGHVAFPSLDDYRNEKTPAMYLVEKEGDISFLPINPDYDRYLDFSRFNTGGDINPVDPKTLNSYLFSDRGVYRPGDTFNIGMITRTADWITSLEGIPLRAEIRDPRDTLMKTVPVTLDKSGFNELSYTTSESSPTGEWLIYLYTIGKNDQNASLLGFTKVNVKEFEPDRMKVSLKLSPQPQTGWIKPDGLKAVVDVQNLFGTPAQDRRVTSSLTLRPVYPRFDKYRDFMFYEDTNNSNGFNTELEEQHTDENGLATISLGLESYAPATYQLQLLAEAFEAGSGRSVAATTSSLISPYDYLIGYKSDGSLGYINRDAKRILTLIAVNPALEKIAATGLTATLLEQKYLSVLTKQSSGVYKYQSKLKEITISEQPLTIEASGTELPLDTKTPGNYILLVKDAKGNVLNRIRYSVAGNANVTRSLDRNAELSIALNKEIYRPGEEIEISVSAPYAGSGLITIERDKVYSWQWFQTDTTSSVQKITVPADMEGNGYINVQFVRNINSDEIFMSPLSYGVMPFTISRETRIAPVVLESPDVIKPGETLSIKVTTEGKQRVAVFAVDEGILQVARYKLKDPLNYFFRKRELSVESAQILDLILPEFSKLVSLTSAPGGDASEDELNLHLNPFKRKRDKPVAYWSGITDVEGERTFEYPVPDYFNGKIRIMAVSVTPERIGHTQRYATVRDDFVLTPNIPAMVAPGDEFEVSLGVANNLEGLHGQKADIRIDVDVPRQLTLIGKTAPDISLAEKREGVLRYRFKALSSLGNATLTFHANYGDKTALREASISVRPASPYRTQTIMGRMAGSEEKIGSLRQMYDAYAKRDAQVSHSPFVLTSGLASYLENYPYYCSEQLTSQAIPLLIQNNHPELRSKLSRNAVEQQLRSITNTLLSRQNNAGGIGMWRSSPQTDPFVTPYVVLYLLEAKESNYPIPQNLLNNANRYLKELAGNTAMRDLYQLRLRAFATYLLTRQGEVTTHYLASIQKTFQQDYSSQWQKDYISSTYLAASYKMLKMDEQAEELLANPWKSLNDAYNKAWWTHNYYDPLVQNTTLLYLITRHFPEKVQHIPAQSVENMVMMLKEERYTTHSAAMSILALDSYSRSVIAQPGNESSLTISTLSHAQKASAQLISSLNGMIVQGSFNTDAQQLIIANNSDSPAWYSVTQVGYDSQPPQKAVRMGLEIVREYQDEEGNPVDKIVLGETINVHLKIRSNSENYLTNLAIVDLLPGGFEVVQQTAPPAEGSNDEEEENDEGGWRSPLTLGGSSWYPEYSDIREDRVIIYGSATKEVKEFIYQIKATNVGTYLIPPAFGEAMYNRDIQALSLGGTSITVLPAEQQ